MFLTHSMMGLIVLTVLSLCLPVWSAVTVIQPYRVVSTNGTAQIQCFLQPQPSHNQIQPEHDTMTYPYPEPEDFRVILLKGLHSTQEFCSSIVDLTEQRQTYEEKEGEVLCHAQVREGTVEVTVSGLKATDTDIYRCEIEVFYPPPYLRIPGNGTLIHVLDSSECPVPEVQAQIANQGDGEEEAEGDSSFSVPVIILLILVVLVLIIIIYVQTLQCERGRREIVRPVSRVFHKADAAPFSFENIA
ncbi:cytotoxic T-lymphocyte protein 4 [Scomber scombrus]|uniref:cytotoxic T-lymphocyte protein 4 n=1 Tax=Scomber scombrus TaxID=13677 RepID=UPI002DDA5F8A|nr:cytotoxic T-lymphocyte protein 4 [Scomber scombrus]